MEKLYFCLVNYEKSQLLNLDDLHVTGQGRFNKVQGSSSNADF